MQEPAERYRRAFQSMEDGFCIIQLVFDADQKAVDYVIVEVNAAFEKQTGIQSSKGKRISEIAPDYVEHRVEMYGQIAQSGTSQRFQYQQADRWYEGYACRVGSTEDMIAILLHDITEHKRLAEKLAGTNQELAQCREDLRGLATELTLAEQREQKRLGIELQDGLAERLVVARLKLGQLQERGMLDVPSEELLKEVDTLLTRSLVYTRTLVADLSPLVLQDLGLPAAVKWLAERMRHHGLAVTVHAALPKELALPEVHAVFLFQSVRELLLNTLKHAKCRSASVLLTVTPPHVQIEVHDDGVGFTDEGAASGSKPSTSGLSSIRERIKALGGAFEMDSRPEAGTKATLKLPLEAAALGEGNQVKTDLPKVRGGIIRVLLADDHAMVRQGLKSVLDAYADMKVVGEAADGEAAVRLTGDLLPSVVLMDINMPLCNGIEATRRIKAKYPDVIVIGLSVNAGDHHQEAMLEAGAHSLMTKEAAVEQLYTLIYQAVKPGVLPFSPLR